VACRHVSGGGTVEREDADRGVFGIALGVDRPSGRVIVRGSSCSNAVRPRVPNELPGASTSALVSAFSALLLTFLLPLPSPSAYVVGMSWESS
jgi:hypothetical protein